MNVPWSEVLTGGGLLMNIVGVYFLTLTDIASSKPLQMWWFYFRHVDRENPEETDREDYPVRQLSPVGGGMGTIPDPSSPEEYDSNVEMVRNQSIAAVGLIGGFTAQFLALLI